MTSPIITTQQLTEAYASQGKTFQLKCELVGKGLTWFAYGSDLAEAVNDLNRILNKYLTNYSHSL